MGKDPKGRLRQATKIAGGQLEGYKRRNKIGGGDLDDLYRFKIGDRSAIDLNIDKLKGDANVEVFRFKKARQKVNKAIGNSDFAALSKKDIRKNLKRVGRSRTRGTEPESISKKLKQQGTYIIRVYSDEAKKTPYRMRLNVTPLGKPDSNGLNNEEPNTGNSGPGSSGNDGSLTSNPGTNNPVAGGPGNGGTVTDNPNTDGLNNGNSDSVNSLFTAEWVRQFGSAQNDQSYAIAIRDNQTIYLSGEWAASQDQITADAFLASYTSSGEQNWLEQFGSSANDRIDSLALTPSGQIVGGGITNGEPSTSVGETSSAYRIKYTDNTQVFALAESQDPSVSNTVGLGVAVNGDGEIYQVGYSRDTNLASNSSNIIVAFLEAFRALQTEETEEPTEPIQIDLLDSLINVYDGNGSLVESIDLNLSGNNATYNVAIDDAQNTYFTGFTNGALNTNFTPQEAVQILFSDNPGQFLQTEPFIAKISPTGEQLWMQTIDNVDFGNGEDIAIDSVGNVYVAGVFSANLDGNVSQGELDGFIAKYDIDGNRQWLKPIATEGVDRVRLVVDGRDRLIAAGYTGGSLFEHENLGGSDGWLAHLDSNGNVVTSTQFGTDGNETLWGIDVDASGQIYVTGSTDGDFGGDNLGELDAWVAKYRIR